MEIINSIKYINSTVRDTIALFYQYRKIFSKTTIGEFKRRYAGSVLGRAWIFLYPTLLLSIYLFVYIAVFKMRFGVGGQLQYVVFVFSGLIPYIGFMESAVQSCVAIKQNIHLIKNVMLPIELIPARVVAISMITQFVSMIIIVFLTTINGTASFHLLWMPAVFILQMLFLIGLSWILSCLGVALLDIGHFINLLVLLLLFVSPIGFSIDMVPGYLKAVCYLNPIFYMAEMYRCSFLDGTFPEILTVCVYVFMCLGTFVLGSVFFRKFKNFLVDYE